ncbi:MAG: NADH-quinone oxidoreductase subunit L, partial [Bacteroidota bacterium]|nr:NADH-quinone oxidoreductase subunit L [Bacteroidota bacterium]
MKNLILLIPLLPFIGFLINGLGRKYLSKPLISIIGCGVILVSFVISMMIFTGSDFSSSSIHYFDFINVGYLNGSTPLTIPFSFQVDQLSILFLLIITGVGFLIHVYSTAYMKEETPEHYGRYFSYLNLFVFSMLLLVLGGNFVIMFIGWEGVGLCSYLLIGFWFKNNDYNKAANKAFVMNRIGDLGFLIAIFWIISKLGTVSYGQVFSRAAELSSADITAITLLLFIGATGKSAQIPLFTWLPDAMAGPTPVSALIHAATMVTAGIYMIARCNILYSMTGITQNIVAITGLATAILAATIALKQNDIKKVLAYSTVSQLGFMFLALGVGAYTAAVFHVITHAFFKALLFLGAGSVITALHHQQDIRNMGGLKNKLPITHITFLLGCFAIAGIPGFSGFFSKDEILAGAYIKNPMLYFVAVAGSLLTAFYMFRLYAMTFRGKFRGTPEQEHHLHESPAAITIPLIILALLSVVGGFIGIPEVFAKNAHWLEHFLAPIFSQSTQLKELPHSGSSTEIAMMAGVSVLVIGTIILAWKRFSTFQKTDVEETGLEKVLQDKWYVDELYNKIIVYPLNTLGRFFNNVFERSGIDGIVNGVGRLVQYGGRQM